MDVGVIGLSYQVEGLYFREVFANIATKFISDSKKLEGFFALPLFTCNRVELYFSSPNLHQTSRELLDIVQKEICKFPFHGVYTYFGSACFHHLIRVTAGLDSALVGETEIQGQVKKSYQDVCAQVCLPSCLHYIFQKSLKIGKNVRTCWLNAMSTSCFEKSICQYVENSFNKDECYKILFVGASEINCKLIHQWKRKDNVLIALTNRSPIPLKEIAQKEDLEVLNWQNLSSWKDFDVVIVGTKAGKYLLEDSSDVIKTKVILDLSVPRNVDPKLKKYKNISLLNIDQIHQKVTATQVKQHEKLQEVDSFIEKALERHVGIFQKKQRNAQQLLVAGA
jgi:glutamyl-tRNA reductase